MRHLFRTATALTLTFALLIPSVGALTVEETLDLLETYYLDEIPDYAREQETVEGVLAALGDPYTLYLPAVEYEEFLESVNGESVVGIGVQVHQVQDKGIEIISVLPNSPALEAGLEAGDCILRVDGVLVTTLEQAQALIGGEEGTTVQLTILDGDGVSRSVKMTRRSVDVPIVTYELVEGVPFIDCSSFGSSTVDVVREAMEEYSDWSGPVVMDLRSNPGGTDTATAGTAGVFVGGATICYYIDGAGRISSIYTVNSTVDYTDEPLIILTSNYSASGSEMFAGAIRSYFAGIAIGTRTYGKGIAQYALDEDNYPDLFDGDSLKVTTYRFYTPDGVTNDTVGVIPTLVIDDEYVEDVAVLLASPKPAKEDGYLKLILGGSTFYVEVAQATSEEYLPAFQQLLSAITPYQKVYYGHMGKWIDVGVEWAAELMEVSYESRNYTDVAGTQYEDELNTLAIYELLPQMGGADYGTEGTITRGDFAYMVAYGLQLHTVEGNPFPDVEDDDPNLIAISALYAKGMVKGDENGNFNPDEAITGQEAVTLLANVAQWVSKNVKIAQLVDGFTEEYLAQFDQYAQWAQSSAATLDYLGALMEDIQPTETIQRDEAGAMIYTFFAGSGLLWD